MNYPTGAIRMAKRERTKCGGGGGVGSILKAFKKGIRMANFSRIGVGFAVHRKGAETGVPYQPKKVFFLGAGLRPVFCCFFVVKMVSPGDGQVPLRLGYACLAVLATVYVTEKSSLPRFLTVFTCCRKFSLSKQTVKKVNRFCYND